MTDDKAIRWHFHHVEETPSTNLLARSGKAWDVFTADYQTSGRGRLDHVWLSPWGENVMMSVVLDVQDIPPVEVATLPLAVGLAVAEGLSRHVADLRIKWPNDVLCGDRKIAGILCERHADHVIAGIGVNVRQTRFSPDIAARATSLALQGSAATREEAQGSILDSLARVFAQWRRGGFAALARRLKRLDFLAGRFVVLRSSDNDDAPITGICAGIAHDGALLVGDRRIYSGEVHVEQVT